MRTIIVGLGNPILGDDGVGWKVADEVRRQLPADDRDLVDFDCLSLGGLSLMERLVGYERAIVIDSINLGRGPVGAIHEFDLADLPANNSGHTAAAHDTSLITALELGRRMGVPLPDRVQVVAIESPNVYDFSDELTPAVAASVPGAARAVLDLLCLPKEAVT
jgi:hydrogenase maturation protease